MPTENPNQPTDALGHRHHSRAPRQLFEPAIVKRAVGDAFRKLDPRLVAKNPVMFVVEVGSAATTFFFLRDLFTGAPEALFSGQITLWLWFTVVFANFAEAMAEGRGKAQADALRKTKTESMARKLVNGREEAGAGNPTAQGRPGGLRGGRYHPRRRGSGGGHRLGGRVGDHGGVGAGHPRERRRPQRGHGSAPRCLSDRIVIRITSNPARLSSTA